MNFGVLNCGEKEKIIFVFFAKSDLKLNYILTAKDEILFLL